MSPRPTSFSAPVVSRMMRDSREEATAKAMPLAKYFRFPLPEKRPHILIHRRPHSLLVLLDAFDAEVKARSLSLLYPFRQRRRGQARA